MTMRNNISLLVSLSWVLLSFPVALSFSLPSPRLQVGNKVPWVDFHWGFNPPQYVNIPMHVGSRNVLIVGVQGAWLPQSGEIARSYVDNSEILNQKYGIDEVMIYAVNDGGVMGIWQKTVLQTPGTIVTCFADPAAEFTKECGLPLISEYENGLLGRCPNFVLHVDDCIVKQFIECSQKDDIQPVCASTIMNVLQGQTSMSS